MRARPLCAIAASLLLSAAVHADAIPPHIAAAVSDRDRPAEDRARDPLRKPAEVIAFAGLQPGDKVADLMPGKGYFTRIFCKAVGGSGRVYAVSLSYAGKAPAPNPPTACGNVDFLEIKPQMRPAPELWSSSDDPGGVYEYWSTTPAAERFTAPEPLDLIWTSENYHDLHNERLGNPDLLTVNQALFAALKPGGILIVEDHAAQAGSGARDTATLHRIDPEQAKREVLAAGFVYAGESPALRHADDPHTAKAHDLHDRTDRFLLKFRKPG